MILQGSTYSVALSRVITANANATGLHSTSEPRKLNRSVIGKIKVHLGKAPLPIRQVNNYSYNRTHTHAISSRAHSTRASACSLTINFRVSTSFSEELFPEYLMDGGGGRLNNMTTLITFTLEAS